MHLDSSFQIGPNTQNSYDLHSGVQYNFVLQNCLFVEKSSSHLCVKILDVMNKTPVNIADFGVAWMNLFG